MANTENLLTRLNANDPGAIEEIFNKKYKALTLQAYLVIKNEAEAQDIARTKIFKLHSIGIQFNSWKEVEGYLHIAIHKACLNYLKKADREASRHAAAQLFNQPIQQSTALTQLEYNDVVKRIITEIKKLPPQCAQVMELALFEELKHDEIAEKLRISAHQVSVQYSYGRQKLRELLKDKGTDFN